MVGGSTPLLIRSISEGGLMDDRGLRVKGQPNGQLPHCDLSPGQPSVFSSLLREQASKQGSCPPPRAGPGPKPPPPPPLMMTDGELWPPHFKRAAPCSVEEPPGGTARARRGFQERIRTSLVYVYLVSLPAARLHGPMRQYPFQEVFNPFIFWVKYPHIFIYIYIFLICVVLPL